MKEMNWEEMVPFTIENQLKAYSECKGHTDRHEILWHEWNHNKRWLIQIQQLIYASFPSYSKHDSSHSESVLHNIEMLLGEENIKALSATDCFVILHTVYIHDIGMCITHEDRVNILRDSKFQDFLMRAERESSGEMSHYADVLMRQCFPESGGSGLSDLLEEKLEIYYAVIYLVAEFQRRDHGKISEQRLLDWIDQPDKLGIGFSTVEIPSRLFYAIARCASAHTRWEFDAIMELDSEDSGYAHDYVHPRFVAILLQLGDALDMDNNRFHPLTGEYLGNMPRVSQIHYRKHKAIRRLWITNKIIGIRADCKNQEELRQIRQECDGIQRILKNAAYHWSVIRPENSNMVLPTFENPVLLLNGRQIPLEHVEARFEISQEKAFQLIEGNNIYKNEGFVFLRELLQNAVDATKQQYYKDCVRLGYKSKDCFENPIRLGKLHSPLAYPIEIEMIMVKSKNGCHELITEEELKNPAQLLAAYVCGVLVRVRDYATGISSEDIRLIANVGSSYEKKKEKLEKMPGWLQPTANFGVGLQSAFLAGDRLTAVTRTRYGDYFEISFYPRHRGTDGYINVKPLEDEDDEQPYGTCFEIFVANDKRKLHKDSLETWDGQDPFQVGYEQSRKIRHAGELMKQMALYLKKLVGELLFPIHLKLQDCRVRNEADKRKYYHWETFCRKFADVGIELRIDGNQYVSEKAEVDSRVSWAYNLDTEAETNQDVLIDCRQISHENRDIYRLDMEQMKLYVWNHKYNAYACLGIRGILELRERSNLSKNRNVNNQTRIFYKGMQVTKENFRKDANLLEYIDLKERLDSRFLKLNRDGFSQMGYDYLDEVYEDILGTIRAALQYFGKKGNTSGLSGLDAYPYMKKLFACICRQKEKFDACQEKTKEDAEKMGNMLTAAAAFSYFSMVNIGYEVFDIDQDDQQNGWDQLARSCQGLLADENLKKNLSSTMFHLPVYGLSEDGKALVLTGKNESILNIADRNNKYGIISYRENRGQQWSSRIVELKDFYQKAKEEIRKLRSFDNLQRRMEIISGLDAEAEAILRAAGGESRALFGDRGFQKVQMLIKWLLTNVPTMALFSTDDGNVRLNLLDVDVCDSVYLNNSMKCLIVDRIREEYGVHQYDRFNSMVWTGFSYLSIQKPRVSSKFVKRGKLARIGYGEMILPLPGHMTEKMEAETMRGRLERYELALRRNAFLYADQVKLFIESHRESDLEKTTIKNRYGRLMKEMSGRCLDDQQSDGHTAAAAPDLDALLTEEREEKLTEEELETLVCGLEDGADQESKERSEKLIRARILPAWNRQNEILRRCEKLRPDMEVFDAYSRSPEFQNLVDFVGENAKMQPSKEQIKLLYRTHVYEMQYALLTRWRRVQEKNVRVW